MQLAKDNMKIVALNMIIIIKYDFLKIDVSDKITGYSVIAWSIFPIITLAQHYLRASRTSFFGSKSRSRQFFTFWPGLI